jgi:hypothetical protein
MCHRDEKKKAKKEDDEIQFIDEGSQGAQAMRGLPFSFYTP